MQVDIKGINDTVSRWFFYLAVMLCTILLSNGIYLALIDFIEKIWSIGIQNRVYQFMFAMHLLIGLFALLVTAIYVFRHSRRAARGRQSDAGKQGRRLVVALAIIFVSGILLTRGIEAFEVFDRNLRILLYFLHVALPVLAIFIYLAHRRAGSNKKQISVMPLALMLVIFCISPLIAHVDLDKQVSNSEVQTFLPSLIKTDSKKNVTSRQFMLTEYCSECHQDSHEQWRHSAHRYSSFNNPFYRISVENLKRKLKEKGADTRGTRFCAGCHDPVPLMSGEFDNDDFKLDRYVSASAGLTCTVCHSVSKLDSPRGNADFTITPAEHYPFAFSESETLKWFSKLLIKSNPDFHKRTFLKPLHATPEFCASCHKVHIPPEINNYKWLRGQNHYDSFLLSGVSGHSVSSFYYPKKAIGGCADCHMEPISSSEFGAISQDEVNFKGSGYLHDHLFPAANTAITAELENNDHAILKKRENFLKRAATIDIVGIRENGRVDGKFTTLKDDTEMKLEPGKTYLIEVVVRTTGVGHTFTQGTADSNQVWLNVKIENNGKIVAESGRLDPVTGKLSEGSHLINAYLIDREGNKINRRNGEDIYTVLYDNQIPPGAADVVHYQFTVPDEMAGDLSVTAVIKYRKFNNYYYSLVKNDEKSVNDLPIVEIDMDDIQLEFGEKVVMSRKRRMKEDWERLNDYGIGLFRKGNMSQHRQAEEIFKTVEGMGRQEAALNLARLYYKEGRLDEASDALNRLDYAQLDNPWTAGWLTALINRDNGFIDEAIMMFERLMQTEWDVARKRGFDFSKDYRLLNDYAATLLTRIKMIRTNSEEKSKYVEKAESILKKILVIDPENATGYYGMMRVARLVGDEKRAEYYQKKYDYYKVDELASEKAIGLARAKDHYADRNAKAVVIYDLETSDE